MNTTNLIIESIYTRQDKEIPEYLVVIFETNKGFFQVGYGHFNKVSHFSLHGYQKQEFVEVLKGKYGKLEIVDLRVTYDNDMYFLVSNSFLLVLGFVLNSTTEHSINEFWTTEEIYGRNRNVLIEFYELGKVMLPT